MLHFKHYAYAMLMAIPVSCVNREKPVDRVLQIKEISDLATTEFNVTKIVKASDDKTWYKIGDRKILISVEADLKAGIDLSQLKAEDISINGKEISINLPAPRLISLNMPPGKVKVEYEELGLLRDPFDNAARDALLAQAEKQIRRDVAATGIFTETERNTRLLLAGFLRQAGYENINIRFGNRNRLP